MNTKKLEIIYEQCLYEIVISLNVYKQQIDIISYALIKTDLN